MTNERRKAVFTLGGTLIIGFLLGMLIPGLFQKIREHRGRPERGIESEHKRDWFTGTINHIVKPDSAQARKIKPVTDWASARIDSLETSSNRDLAVVLDSVKMRIKPMVTAEQFKRLDEFDARAKGHWNGRGRHPGRGK
jgi:hypothetical protein